MKILLISGHGAGDPGAVSQFGKEADETIYMVEEIKKTLSKYEKPGSWRLTSEIITMYWKSILIPVQQILKETDRRQVRKSTLLQQKRL